MMSANEYDVVVIGSGPAGIQSIINLQHNDLKIALIDDSPTLGGQIYKNVEENSKHTTLFKKEYLVGLDLIKQVDLTDITYINNATVWSIRRDKSIYYSKEGTSTKIEAKKIIIAVGSMERAFPVKGWTLPGVIGATAAQIILKESGIVKDDAVFVGTGPLFYYVIAQYIDAGAKIKAIVDTTPLNNYFSALKYLPRALLNLGPLIKGLGFLIKFKKHKIKMYNFVDSVEFEGANELERVVVNDGKEVIDTKIAFVHNGFAPNLNLQLEAGCKSEFDLATRTLVIKTNKYMQSSQENIYVVGDGKAIRGVDVSKSEAKIAVLKILNDLQKESDSSFQKKKIDYFDELKSNMNLRGFLDALYKPRKEFISPCDDDIVVCRCEEVSVKDVKYSIKQSLHDLNSIKGFTRAGMGSCQSRFCGLSMLEVLSRETNTPIEDLKYLRARSPIKPIRIEEMGRIK